MKVCVSVKGRFHAFQLAHALQQKGYLQKLITTYPYSHAKRYGLDRKLVTSLFSHEIFNQGWNRFAPKWLKKNIDPSALLCTLYDHNASLLIPKDADLVVAWSSSALHTLKKAKKMGLKTVLERGSTHIQFAKEILEEEYARMGLTGFSVVSAKIVARELAEYELADYIAVPSNFVVNTFVAKGVDPKRLIQTPYGVDLAHFYPHPKKDDVFRIIFCGARSVRKGIYYLLKAFTELNLPNAELWLIGNTTADGAQILQQFKHEKIFLKGPFPEFSLAEYYSQGSVFCLPSIEEGMAMVVPQAMSCGLPIICTHNTGGGEVVRDQQDGFLISARDIEQLKEKILFCYQNPALLKKMGQSALERVRSGFSWNNYGEKIISAYERL